MFDSNGIEILPTDRVCVGAVGYGARHADNGIIRPVLDMNRTRVVILDADGIARAIGGRVLSVMRRDGTLGFEHNCRQNRDFSGRWKRPASFTPRLRCVGPVQP